MNKLARYRDHGTDLNRELDQLLAAFNKGLRADAATATPANTKTPASGSTTIQQTVITQTSEIERVNNGSSVLIVGTVAGLDSAGRLMPALASKTVFVRALFISTRLASPGQKASLSQFGEKTVLVEGGVTPRCGEPVFLSAIAPGRATNQAPNEGMKQILGVFTGAATMIVNIDYTAGK